MKKRNKSLIFSAFFCTSLFTTPVLASQPQTVGQPRSTVNQTALQAAPTPAQAPTKESRPNFLLVLVDDLGWSDLGAFGGEIHTPILDSLAKEGVRFTGFHTAPTCAPTRSMLMSGTDNHVAGIGIQGNPAAYGISPERPGYEGVLNTRVASIAEVLQQGGYRTLMSGKWHLGGTDATSPAARGFERSFSLDQGLSNFWGADQDAKSAAIRAVPTYREDGKPVSYPAGTFTTDYFTDRLIGYLEEGRTDPRPFFAYLAYTAPHWPIMAPEAHSAKYKGRYDKGYEVLRAERLARQKQLGLVPQNAQPHDLVNVKPWDSLTPAEQRYEARKMEVYAGMVDNLDANMARVISTLKRQGKYENTVIVFLSDNGPEGSPLTAPMNIENTPEAIKAAGIDNSYENIGKANSYLGYGMGWAQANSTPSWLVKGYPTQGGTRVSAFASGKGVKGDARNGGRLNHGTLHVQDIMPTFLDIAGIQHPTQYKGREIAPLRGLSFKTVLNGTVEDVRGDAPLGTELFFRRALRKGDWKAVFLPIPTTNYPRNGVGDNQWRLFNLAQDPSERHDLAKTHPDKLQELIDDWYAYAAQTGVFIPPHLSGDTLPAQPTPTAR